VRVVRLEEFRDKITMAAAIAAVERGFKALALGQATLPEPMAMERSRPTASIHVKGAQLTGGLARKPGAHSLESWVGAQSALASLASATNAYLVR
jgi:hypothetical protein